MPLTSARPPTALRAIHIRELDAAVAAIATGIRDYLKALFDVLILPHSEWHGGTGAGLNGTEVEAALSPSPGSPDQPQASFRTGTGDRPTAGAISGQALLLVCNVSGPDNGRKFENWYDGLLIKATPYTVPLPPPVPEPQPPAPADMTELDDDDKYRAYIDERAKYAAAVLEWAVDDAWRKRFAYVTRFWPGVASGVSVPGKTATVALDPMQGDPISNSQVCGFGSRNWTGAQLQGHAVRVMIDRQIGYLVDDWS